MDVFPTAPSPTTTTFMGTYICVPGTTSPFAPGAPTVAIGRRRTEWRGEGVGQSGRERASDRSTDEGIDQVR
jgi:hypothetical protein